ncbi:MAG: PAS domain-containing protein [Bdellovibrionaceae bacterium]|nr:PAS domain-containing protein [Pseudobdellovibrionaceae bacterium]
MRGASNTTGERMLAAEIVLLVALAVYALWSYLRVYRPMRRLVELGRRISQRESTQGFLVSGEWGIGRLSSVLRELDAQLRALQTQMDREGVGLNTVLANMTEGVVILHPDGTVRTANSAFRAMFELPPQIQGRRLRDLTRHIEIREAEDNALLRRKTDTREVTIHEVPGQVHKLRVVQMSYAPLPAFGERETGAVIVFHDISRIKQYEMSRREFVANVSHELRTPLSIFKGYLETLQTAAEQGGTRGR